MFQLFKKFYMEIALSSILVGVLVDNLVEHDFTVPSFFIISLTLLSIYLAHLLWQKVDE